ncbi:NHL domain-containing protein [Taibaiella soli]|uniref:Ig-like domain-containing protein n=1 Tax=Taibaiella soli TaxID=1649169 RepID=A0A2W2AVX6_9BACT|nr:T9SS type A sorting domain-containing protein [Taibaiella soli]PZF72124.1 hypothetical protein DN068_14410 [Taibaiella soli]
MIKKLLFTLSIGLFTQAVSTKAQIINTIAGNTTMAGYSGDGGPSTSAVLYYPTAITIDKNGNIYIIDQGLGAQKLRKIDANGIITTIAGNDTLTTFSGDGGPAINAGFQTMGALAVDTFGNVFISDPYDNRIRKINTAGIISTVAGNGTTGFSGDGNAAVNANISYPLAMTTDLAGNLYFADRGNHRIRKVTTSGTISTFAGDGNIGVYPNVGDGGQATAAKMTQVTGLVMSPSGTMYVADEILYTIRKIASNGIVSTIVGASGSQQFGAPRGLALDNRGNLYIDDYSCHKIRIFTPSGILSDFAGSGNCNGGSWGDGGIATNAALWEPNGVALIQIAPSCVAVCIADSRNNRIRVVVANNSKPTVHISASQTTVTTGTSVTLTATPTDAGAAPTYQWYNWGTPVGSQASTYTYVPQDGDQITCKVTNTDCNNGVESVESNYVTLNVTPTPSSVTEQAMQNTAFVLYPNPNNGVMSISGNWFSTGDKKVSLKIFNALGQKVFEESVSVDNSVKTHAVNLNGQLAPGTYQLIISGAQVKSTRFTVSGNQ